MYYSRNSIKIKRTDYNVDLCINSSEFKFKCLIWENKSIYHRSATGGLCRADWECRDQIYLSSVGWKIVCRTRGTKVWPAVVLYQGNTVNVALFKREVLAPFQPCWWNLQILNWANIYCLNHITIPWFNVNNPSLTKKDNHFFQGNPVLSRDWHAPYPDVNLIC